jgi:transposase-like protein
MAKTPDAGKQRHWLDLVQRWQRSKLAIRDFCERHQLSEANFYAWRRVLRERGLIQDPPTESATSATPAFVKLTVSAESAAASSVDLILSDRRLLRVRPGFDADMLLQLVCLLEERA